MEHWKDRTQLLLGQEGMDKLNSARVAVIGLGGVGGAVAEALGRVGVGNLLLVDHDEVSITNINRQILATRPLVGVQKCEAARHRLLEINPDISIECAPEFLLPDHSDFLLDYSPDFIIDAIDTMTAKLWLAKQCYDRGIPLYCCLGTGNRLDPSQLRYGDIADTSGTGCPLSRVMRRELRKLEVPSLRVVFSVELPMRGVLADSQNGRHSPGSSPFVPPAAGYLLASAAVREYLGRP